MQVDPTPTISDHIVDQPPECPSIPPVDSSIDSLITFKQFIFSGKLENHAIYKYIQNFNCSDNESILRFLEILSDFLLTISYDLRHRSDILLNDCIFILKLIGYLGITELRYSSLLILNILSYSNKIVKIDLEPIVDIFCTQTSNQILRLCAAILRNAVERHYEFSPAIMHKLKTVIETKSFTEECISSDLNIIHSRLTHIDYTKLFNEYMRLLRKQAIQMSVSQFEDQFWCRNMHLFNENITEVLELLLDCLNSKECDLILASCISIENILRRNASLYRKLEEINILQALLELVDSVNEETDYSIMEIVNLYTAAKWKY